MINITKMFLTNKAANPQIPLIKLKYIVLHYTANYNKGADAVANRNFFNTVRDENTSSHYIVDDKQIIQCVEDLHVAYHVGSKSYTTFGQSIREGTANSPNKYTIGIEMCVNKDGDFDKMYQNTVDLVVYLLKKYNLTVDNLCRHFDITGKQCPLFMLKDEDWNKFKEEVKKGLGITQKPTLRLGSKGETVKELQKNLLILGYDVGKSGIDGDFGSATLSAVKALQKDNGLTVDGIVGNKTWTLIDKLIEEKNKPVEQPKQEEYPTLRYGDKGTYVGKLQQLLNEHGASLEVDQIFGNATKSTLLKFQQINNLLADAICGKKTWSVLLKGGKNISESIVRKNIQYKEYIDKNGYKTYMIICRPENIEIKLFYDTLHNKKINGINGTYFNMVNPFTSKACWGLAVNNSKPIGENSFLTSWDSSIKRGVVAWDGKNMILKRINKYTEISNMIWGISGIDLFDFSVAKDAYLPDVYRTAQRTTLGFDDDNNVYLIVNEKQTIQQQIQMCKNLGIKGISLDSGGSSQLYFDGKGYKSSRKVNNIVAVKEV